MTSDLNLWDAPREKGNPLDVLDAGGQVGVTGVVKRGFAQILLDGQVRWVNDRYLAEKKPVAPKADPSSAGGTAGAVSFAPCADGTAHRVRADLVGGPAVPGGLQRLPGAVQLRRLRRARRAQLGPGDRLHDQRLRPRPGRRGLGPRARLRARPVRRPLAASTSGRPSAPRRAGARCRTAARRPRTTTTTCTSPSTDLTFVTVRS